MRREALGAAYTSVSAILRRLDEMPVSVKLSAVRPLSERS